MCTNNLELYTNSLISIQHSLHYQSAIDTSCSGNNTATGKIITRFATGKAGFTIYVQATELVKYKRLYQLDITSKVLWLAVAADTLAASTINLVAIVCQTASTRNAL